MNASRDSNVACEVDGAVCTIRFDRPEKKNALTVAMYARAVALLREAAADPAIAVVVFAGNGGTFTAGNDLGDFLHAPPMADDSPVLQLLFTLVDYEKPVVAAVEGGAVGIGTTMLLHCDLVLAASSAKFVLPFVGLGIVPEGASTILLPRAAGIAKASQLLLLGDPFDAAAAKDAGIVSEIVPEGGTALAARAMERAKALAAKPPEALAASKRLLRDPIRDEVREAIRREAAVFRERLVSAEAKEAFSAFLEKRAPVTPT